jgi:hypothetical protein
MPQELERYELFKAELMAAHQWQLFAGICLLEKGLAVYVPELRICPEGGNIDDYSDSGDLFAYAVVPAVDQDPKLFVYSGYRIECKSLNLKFTDPATFPFEDIIVDRVNTWRRKAEKKLPDWIFFISRETGAIVTLNIKLSRRLWKREVVHFKRRSEGLANGYDRECYKVTRKALLSFDETVQFLTGERDLVFLGTPAELS